MCIIADMSSTLALMVVIFKVALGLGAVIFVHELGHFLVAKACGVRCDKFFVGFDIGGYKISRKWGETEYGIGILPLGGYVKMFGQDDDPAHMAEQLEHSQVAAGNEDGVEVTGPKGERYTVDRRSYLAKSVPQRMAIISAGVVMNVIFAVIFAVVAYGLGVSYMPSIVSGTMPGSAAWMAGLEPGDEVVKIGERENPTFRQLSGAVTLGDLENGIPCVIRRAADDSEVELTLTPQQGRGLARVGVISPISLTLVGERPVDDGSPAADAKLIDPAVAGADDERARLRGGDRITQVGDVDVEDYRGLVAQLAQQAGEPLRVTVRRPAEKSKQQAAGKANDAPADVLTFELPARPLRRIGLVMKMGPIMAVQPDSVAAEAGLEAGDVIVAVDGQPLDAPASLGDWDSSTLPERMRRAAAAGQSVTLSVRRPGQDEAADQSLEIRVTPRVPTLYHSSVPPRAPMGVPALGIAYRIENEVTAVVPDSPAANAETPIEPGDRLTAVKFMLPKDSKGKEPDPYKLTLGPTRPNWIAKLIRGVLGGEVSDTPGDYAPSWPLAFDLLQALPDDTKLAVSVRRDGQWHDVTLAPTTVGELFAADRGLNLKPIRRMRRAESFGEQVRYGWDETVDALGMVFRFLSMLGTQVPLTALAGPVTIATVAGYEAYEGLAALLVFLTMLSANLAVLNFLPIPLLDGGHMVFLAYEGVRGRPASERFVVALHMLGFAFLVGLMLFVIALDVGAIPRNL